MRNTLKSIMRRAWEIRRERARMTMGTALRLAWAEHRGEKLYTFRLEDVRPQISAYLVKLIRNVQNIHDSHKVEILRNALSVKVDALGVAVLDGKTVGVCRYAVRNA